MADPKPNFRPRSRGRIHPRNQMRRPPIDRNRLHVFRAPQGDAVRVMVLGGLEEVGRNCTLIEYKNDIILIDMGLEFPDEEMPGVDYIIPNMSYLKGKEKNVRGVIITHGHLDHIGGIPHAIPQIGNPPVYALPMAAGIIRKRQTDFRNSHITVKDLTIDTVLQLGVFKVSFIHINHNIPDCAMVVVETPAGNIIHTGDWKFDFHPVGTKTTDIHKMASWGEKGVTLLMGDSTNSNMPGHQISEKVIGAELYSIIANARGRIIIGTFSSLLSRVTQVIQIAEILGRKIAIDGFSMKSNVEIAIRLSHMQVNPKIFIPIEAVEDYPDDKVLIICTGAQGEKNAALSRIANDEHRSIHVKKGDTVIFSSSIIPGNENSVQRLKDTFSRKRAMVIQKEIMDVHAGGHAKKEDIKLLLTLLKPKYYMPIEGLHFLLRENAEVALALGYKESDVIIADNGQVVTVEKDRKGDSIVKLTEERVPAEHVFVDGLGVGDVSQIVLRDRKTLSDDGVVVIIVQIDKKTGAMIGPPEIMSRGFVQMKDNHELAEHTKKIVQKFAGKDPDPQSAADTKFIKNTIRDEVGKFLFTKTERRPMVLPVVIEL
ncbi:MAG: ribonuclease J [Patescibacteria group bacterium]|jgi:ribonuclease J